MRNAGRARAAERLSVIIVASKRRSVCASPSLSPERLGAPERLPGLCEIFFGKRGVAAIPPEHDARRFRESGCSIGPQRIEKTGRVRNVVERAQHLLQVRRGAVEVARVALAAEVGTEEFRAITQLLQCNPQVVTLGFRQRFEVLATFPDLFVETVENVRREFGARLIDSLDRFRVQRSAPAATCNQAWSSIAKTEAFALSNAAAARP